MATPTQAQPYQGSYPTPTPASAGGAGAGAAAAGGPSGPAAAGGYASERTGSNAQAQYPSSAAPGGTPQQFDKYCIIHVATTCDEHGVYVTKDSAEVIEIGWVVVDARDPSLPEVGGRLRGRLGGRTASRDAPVSTVTNANGTQ